MSQVVFTVIIVLQRKLRTGTNTLAYFAEREELRKTRGCTIKLLGS
jgi:hypothetical protein